MKKLLLLFGIVFLSIGRLPAKETELPQEWKDALLVKEDGKPLEKAELLEGNALLKGSMLGYDPGMDYTVTVIINDPIIGDQRNVMFKVRADGSFEGLIPVFTTMDVLLETPFYTDYILVSPNKESTVYFDLQNRQPDIWNVYFSGANAEINNQKNDPKVKQLYNDFFGNYEQRQREVVGMSAQAYRDYLLNEEKKMIDRLSDVGLTRKAYDYMVLSVRYYIINGLLSADTTLRSAYQKKYKSIDSFVPPVMDEAYYSFLKDLPLINDPVSLYNAQYRSFVNSCKFIKIGGPEISLGEITNSMLDTIAFRHELNADEKEAALFLRDRSSADMSDEQVIRSKMLTKKTMQKLADTRKLSEVDLRKLDHIVALANKTENNVRLTREYQGSLFQELRKKKVFTWEEMQEMMSEEIEAFSREESEKSKHITPEVNEKIITFIQKYKDELSQFHESENNERRISVLADLFNVKKGIFTDIIRTQFYAREIGDGIPLEQWELEQISHVENPFYYEHVIKRNNEVLEQIRKNENRRAYNIHALPETEDDVLLHEMLKPFAGRVILLDFWATWCGPCFSAMKAFEPEKQSFKDKGIAFVYLADESSPENTWKNAISGIDGDHFRLSNKQSAFLKAKFGITALPSYVIFDKEGKQIYFSSGFEGAEMLKNKLNKELEK